MAITSFMYNNIFPLLTTTLFLCSSLTSHMMSTNSSRSLKGICLSSGISTWRYAPGKSKVAMSIPSCVSITNELNRASINIVGDEKYSPSFKKLRFLLPFAHVRPLIVSVLFSLIGLVTSKASIFSVLVNYVRSCGSTTGLFGIATLSI